jgi:hypothetical protein
MSEKPFWGRYQLHIGPVPYPLPIVLRPDAREHLNHDVLLDGLEETGALYGHFSDGELVIEAAVKATLPGRTSVSADTDFAVVDQLREHYARGPGWQWCGDCEAWITRARAARIGVVAGRSGGLYGSLIVTPGGWSRGLAINGWLVQLSEGGDAHSIRPVEVVEEAKRTPLPSHAA